MRLFESELPGKLGGMKGSTRCLFTKFGPCFSDSSVSVLRLMIVRSEHEELSRLAAGADKVGGSINITVTYTIRGFRFHWQVL